MATSGIIHQASLRRLLIVVKSRDFAAVSRVQKASLSEFPQTLHRQLVTVLNAGIASAI
jgi:hypothetical protein